MHKRKPILLVDDKEDSKVAVQLLNEKNIQFVEYNIKKFEESCCGDLPTTRAPSVFAPEGVFKGLDGVKEYLLTEKKPDTDEESPSAYW
jgi:hypothetical protein